jgi:hypothetical protein
MSSVTSVSSVVQFFRVHVIKILPGLKCHQRADNSGPHPS